MKFRSSILLSGVFLIFSISSAGASVIFDFESAASPNPASNNIVQNGYELNMDGPYGFFQIHNPTNTTSVPQNGSKFVQMSTQFAYPAVLSRTDNSLFDLFSIDLGEYSYIYTGSNTYLSTTTFKGYTNSGAVLHQSFTVDGFFDGLGGTADFETFSFGSSWTDLVKVEFGFGLTFDNIVLSDQTIVTPPVASVPEPSSLALLLLGTLSLIRIRRSQA